MISIILDQLLKGNRFRDAVVRNAFFIFNGILGGILLNDMLRILYGDFDHKVEFEYGVAGGISALPLIAKETVLFGQYTNNLALSTGMGAGIYFSNRSEAKKPIIPV